LTKKPKERPEWPKRLSVGRIAAQIKIVSLTVFAMPEILSAWRSNAVTKVTKNPSVTVLVMEKAHRRNAKKAFARWIAAILLTQNSTSVLTTVHAIENAARTSALPVVTIPFAPTSASAWTVAQWVTPDALKPVSRIPA